MLPVDAPGAHYDRVTAAWRYLLGEDLHYGLFRTAQEPLVDATDALTNVMIQAAGFRPGGHVLDVGCGTGNPACRLAERLGATVLGISTSDEGLALARKRAQTRELANAVSFEHLDGTRTGLDDASFDGVWVMESSHLMDDKQALIAECARLLQRGGRWVLCDVMLARELPRGEVLRNAREFDLLRRVFGRARMQTRASYLVQAESSRLAVDIDVDLTAATRPTFDRWRDNARRFHTEVASLVGESYADDFARSCDILARFWDNGTLGYGLVAASRPE